jgi:hypothetical protein
VPDFKTAQTDVPIRINIEHNLEMTKCQKISTNGQAIINYRLTNPTNSTVTVRLFVDTNTSPSIRDG